MQRPAVCSPSTDGEHAALVAMATAECTERESLIHLCEGGGDAQEKGDFATTRLLTCYQTQPPGSTSRRCSGCSSGSAGFCRGSSTFGSISIERQKCACSLLSRVTPVSQRHFQLWLGFFQYSCNQNDPACKVYYCCFYVSSIIFSNEGISIKLTLHLKFNILKFGLQLYSV